jgi:hypothetical protein
MIPNHARETLILSPLSELAAALVIATVLPPERLVLGLGLSTEPDLAPDPVWDDDVRAIFSGELNALSRAHTVALFRGRSVSSTRWLSSTHFAVYWTKTDEVQTLGGPPYKPSRVALLDNPFTIAVHVHPIADTPLRPRLFNSGNLFVQWLIRVKQAASVGEYGITPAQYESLYEKVDESTSSILQSDQLEEYLHNWRQIPGLPPELYPPEISFDPAMFWRITAPQQMARKR